LLPSEIGVDTFLISEVIGDRAINLFQRKKLKVLPDGFR
jgi:hypothetical protein